MHFFFFFVKIAPQRIFLEPLGAKGLKKKKKNLQIACPTTLINVGLRRPDRAQARQSEPSSYFWPLFRPPSWTRLAWISPKNESGSCSGKIQLIRI